MTGEDQEITLDLSEESLPTDSNLVLPDTQEETSMVATSAEVQCIYMYMYVNLLVFVSFQFDVWLQVLEELGLNALDLVDEAPSMFESPDAAAATNLPKEPNMTVEGPKEPNMTVEGELIFYCAVFMETLTDGVMLSWSLHLFKEVGNKLGLLFFCP